MPQPLTEWFVVLPGSAPAARPALNLVNGLGGRVLARNGGRPWLVGRSARPVTTVRFNGATAALIGTHRVSQAELEQALRRLVATGDIAELMCNAGTYHAVAAVDCGTWVSGDAIGMRPVFYTRVGSAALFGDHARPLAEAAGRVRLDRGHLASQLLGPVPPLALAESGASPYQGVHAVQPGLAAHLDAHGVITARRWWTAPDDEQDLGTGALALRDALRESVALHTWGEETIGCELSGGADSTALSALAYEQGPSRLLNLTRAPADPGNDDVRWTERLVNAQPGARHEILPVGTIPEQFAGLEAPFIADAPSPSATSPSRSAFWWCHAAHGGAQVLLSGKGGDELMLPGLTYLHHARRRDRRTARRHVAGWAALRGVSRREIRRQTQDPGLYQAWLADYLDSGRDLTAPAWEAGPYLPSWLSRDAREALNESVADAARTAEPLHERAHQHMMIAALRGLARWNRLQADAAAGFGVRMAYPYMDRTVVEAALSTRGEHRVSPFMLKPLLQTAMVGIVPSANLARRTKGGYSADTEGAVARHRTLLTALLTEDCALADHGLIDLPRLAAVVEGWDRADGSTDLMLHLTLMAEVWARTTEKRPMPRIVAPLEASC